MQKHFLHTKQQIYKTGDGIIVPDGTRVFPITDPRKQKKDNIPIVEELSLAYGELDRGVKSHIHVHPICTQLTFVLSGELELSIKNPGSEAIEILHLNANEAAVCKPGSFFQLKNCGQEMCKLLYQCTPAFVFELDEHGNPFYNDAIVLSHSWEELKKIDWKIPELENMEVIRKQRTEALRRGKEE